MISGLWPSLALYGSPPTPDKHLLNFAVLRTFPARTTLLEDRDRIVMESLFHTLYAFNASAESITYVFSMPPPSSNPTLTARYQKLPQRLQNVCRLLHLRSSIPAVAQTAGGSSSATPRLPSRLIEDADPALFILTLVCEQCSRFARQRHQIDGVTCRRQCCRLAFRDLCSESLLILTDRSGFRIIRAGVDPLIQPVFVEDVESRAQPVQL